MQELSGNASQEPISSEEQEAAASLLEMSRTAQPPWGVEEASPPPPAAPAPKKRGRKPKKKRPPPTQLMKQIRKVFSNYKKCFSDKLKLDQTEESGVSPIEDVAEAPSGSSTESSPLKPGGGSSAETSPLKPAEGPVEVNKINKIKIIKVQDGASWHSQMVQPTESPPKQCCLGPCPLLPTPPVPVVQERPRLVPAIKSMPEHRLPFKKRRRHFAVAPARIPSKPPTSAAPVAAVPSVPALPKVPITKIWRPNVPESESKIASIQSRPYPTVTSSEGLVQNRLKDDVQVLYETPKVVTPVAPKQRMTRTCAPGRKPKEDQTRQTAPAAPEMNKLMEAVALANQRKMPVTFVIHPMPPAQVASHGYAGSVQNSPPIRQDAPSIPTSTPVSTAVENHSAMMCSSLPVLVMFRILSDSWPLQSKLSVYEIQPIRFVGLMPFPLVSTLVLFHRLRSETKSLHYLNRFPGLCDLRIELMPKMLEGQLQRRLLPVHMMVQQILEEQIVNKEGLHSLQVQYPSCVFGEVIEDQKLVANKVAVIDINENTGCAQIKICVFPSAMLLTSSQATSITVDSWFPQVKTLTEVFRLTIPAWMLFSREVIRLHNN